MCRELPSGTTSYEVIRPSSDSSQSSSSVKEGHPEDQSGNKIEIFDVDNFVSPTPSVQSQRSLKMSVKKRSAGE